MIARGFGARAVFLLSVFMFLAGCAGKTANRQPEQPIVYVLGSIHGNMLDQPKNSLREFVVALDLFRPTLILNEVRPEDPGPVEASIDGAPEQAIVYAFARQTGAVVVPVDWFDDQYRLESAKEDSQMSESLQKEVAPLFDEFRNIVRNGTFEQSQSAETQNLIRKRYDLLAKSGLDSLRRRDAVICRRIREQSHRFRGERVLIVFGLAHKYSLEDCVRELGIEPLSLESWFNPVKARRVLISKEFKNEAVKTFVEARALLKARLKSNYYKVDVESFREKLPELESWIRKTKQL